MGEPHPLYAHLREQFGNDVREAAKWMAQWREDGQRDPLRPEVDEPCYSIRAMATHCSYVLEGYLDDPRPSVDILAHMGAIDKVATEHGEFSPQGMAAMTFLTYMDTRWGVYLYWESGIRPGDEPEDPAPWENHDVTQWKDGKPVVREGGAE